MNTQRERFLSLYAEFGFSAIPLRPRDKRPLRKGWRTPSPAAWIGAPADANIGILTGSASGGLVVLDFDTVGGPREVLGLRPEEVAVQTLVVRTARGWHIYARQNGVSTSRPLEGLDIRAEGALVVAPPSVHPSGAEYVFVGNNRAIAPFSLFESCLSRVQSDPEVDEDVDWEFVEGWIGKQAPRLREAWALLRSHEKARFDRSRADFAVARCLWEGGYSPQQVAQVLLALPGSKAAERGWEYATRTAQKAARPRAPTATARRGRD